MHQAGERLAHLPSERSHPLHSCSTMTRSTMASRRRHVILGLATLLAVLGPGCQSAPPSGPLAPAPPRSAAPTSAPQSATAEEAKYIRWLVEHSMLHQAEVASRRYTGQVQLWQHPYAAPHPRAASALAS